MAGSKRRAVIVGINTYPGAPLAGCVADAYAAATRLEEIYKFPRWGIRVVTNERATAAAIKERLAWLVSGAQPGDELVYCFSGHGVQMAARNDAGEVDKMDECQCPYDFAWSEATVLRDNYLSQVFSRLPAGAHLTVISDSCHSGTLAREWSPIKRITGRTRRARTMPLHADVAWRNVAAVGVRRADRNAIVVSGAWLEACLDRQTAADAWFGGKPRGAFSHVLDQALDANPGGKLTEIAAMVARGLRREGFAQVPLFEGTELHRPFLGGIPQ